MTDAPSHNADDTAPNPAVVAAVRARALEQIRQEQERPGPSRRDRIQVLIFTICAVTLLIVFLDFVVTGLDRIMDIWYPGSISSRIPKPPEPIDPNKAYMIGVIVEGESESSSSSSASSTASRH